MSNKAIALQLASWSSGLTVADLPEAVSWKARLHLVDTIGCAIAGTSSESFSAVQKLVRPETGAKSTIIGTEYKTGADQAALINGMLMHALDFDDTHQNSYMHVSAPILAALLAEAEQGEFSGAEFITAFVAGLETSIRLGQASGTRMHLRGFHPTSVFGTLGATVAVAKLHQLGVAETVSAIGISISQASGVMAYLNDGTDTKTVHPGWAALAAIWAVRLATAGLTGPESGIEGPKGLFATHLSDHDELKFDDLGTRWETLQIAVKPFPVCHSAHGAINCIRSYRLNESLELSEIESIHCTVPTQVVVNMVLEPLEFKRRPRTLYEGKFSLPWLLGLYLKFGRLELETLSKSEYLTDPEVLALADKVSYELETLGPGHDLGARAEVKLKDGRKLDLEVLVPLGMAENPMSDQEIFEKFLSNVSFGDPNFDATRLLAELTSAQLPRIPELSKQALSDPHQETKEK